MASLVLPASVREDVRRALAEDVGDGDLTAGLIPPSTHLTTRVVAREAATISGCAWFDECFAQLPGAVHIDWHTADGQAVAADQELCRLQGDAAAILTGERCALNFLQTLSGTATVTRQYVDQLAGTRARLLDTRKTLPGLRLAQKYAVLCGGGHNHRIGLFDAVLIKENHIAAAGSIARAVNLASSRHPGVLVEVEVENIDELEQACAAGAQRALLDNFTVAGLRAAVTRFGGRIELEASGNITLDSIREVAGTGVDFISTGAITKHLRAIDLSMRFV